jgi:predicted dienelactone hydrolase
MPLRAPAVAALVLGFGLWLGGTAAAQQPIGARAFTVADLPGEPAIPLTVWYPATESGVTADGEPTAIAAAPAPGRRRLIMLSHGSGGVPLNHRELILHLVSAGSIVAAPLHPYDSAGDRSGPGTDLQLLGRPRHIARSIDALLAHPTFGPLIDVARIGIVGYSAGGYTALVVVGGRPNFALGPTHCAQAEHDSGFCGWMRRGGIQRLRPDWTATHDRRVRAAVLLAPAYGIFFDRKGLADVSAPLRLYRAEADDVVRHPFNEERLRRALPRPPEYAVVPGGHFVFVSPCRRSMPAVLCRDSSGVDRPPLLRRMNAEMLDFFDHSLGRD